MFPLSNFEAYINLTILMRGEDYYKANAVTHIDEVSPGEWEATVEGTEIYNLDITINDDHVESWYCNCPYDGSVCKHVVAALFEIRENNKKKKNYLSAEEAIIIEETLTDDHHEKKDLEKLLSHIDKKSLDSFIVQYALINQEFKNKLKEKFLPKPSNDIKTSDYIVQVEQCFHNQSQKYTDRYYSSYEINLDEISYRVGKYLKKAHFLIEQKSFADAASIAITILRCTVEHYEPDQYYNYYDDDFSLSYDCETAGELLIDIVRHTEVNQTIKEDILEGIHKIATNSVFEDYGDIFDIDELLHEISIYSQTTENAIKMLEELIDECKEESWKLSGLIVRKIDLLRKLDNIQEIENTITKYIHLPEVRQINYDSLIKEKNYPDALSLLDEGIRMATELNHYGTIRDWKKKKLEIYKEIKDIPSIINITRELFISEKGDMELYHTLKQYVSPEEWKLFLSDLLAKTSIYSSVGYNIKAQIWSEEKDYDQLMNLIKNESYNKLAIMLNYTQYLPNSYSEEILALYRKEIESYAEQNVSRNHYEYVVKVLKKMLTINGGKKVVDAIVTDFRVKYKRRPSMMELLQGF